MLNWIIARLKEKSTWIQLVTLITTATGVMISPELKESIMAVGLAVASLAGIIIEEKPKE